MQDEDRLSPVLQRALRRAWLLTLWGGRLVGRVVPAPRMAQIEVTNRCNLTCRTCTRLKLPQLGDMPYDDFVRLLDSLKGVRRIWLSGQGEPLLHPELPRMIRTCADRGVHDTIVHTNGMLLFGEMADRIAASGLGQLRVSIDGGNASDMEYLRDGASLERVLQNARAFAARGAVRTSFYSVLNRRNHASAPDLLRLAAETGVSRVDFVETVPLRDESTEREIYDRREYQFGSLPAGVRSETLGKIRREALRHGIDVVIDLKWYRRRCFEPFQKLYVDFQGNVTPCCRIHNEVFVGNILKDGLSGSWYSPAMEKWRDDLLHRGRHRRICIERCNLGIGCPSERNR
jgi:MoaA/NifB/PqqE/SkfB family radical SAM enzyme